MSTTTLSHFSPKELNTILHWRCIISAVTKSGNPFKGSFRLRLQESADIISEPLKQRGWIINEIHLVPIFFKDII